MKYQTTIVIWSNVGHTPITNRDGAYCDELVRMTAEFENPDQAKSFTRELVQKTEHGYMGYYHVIDYPNQNTKNGFTH